MKYIIFFLLIISLVGCQVPYIPQNTLSEESEMNCSGKLYVNGIDICDIEINPMEHYAILPLMNIMEALNAVVKWENDTNVTIFYNEKNFFLDITKFSLQAEDDSFNYLLPPPGIRYSYCEYQQNELYLDSTILKLFLRDIDVNIKIDYSNLIVEVSATKS
jgi:hypothetical protein